MLTQEQKAYNERINKRYKEDMAKKKIEKPEKTKNAETTEKEVSKSKIRAENAQKLRDFMTTELGLDDAEQRKTMSRAYGMITKEMNK